MSEQLGIIVTRYALVPEVIDEAASRVTTWDHRQCNLRDEAMEGVSDASHNHPLRGEAAGA